MNEYIHLSTYTYPSNNVCIRQHIFFILHKKDKSSSRKVVRIFTILFFQTAKGDDAIPTRVYLGCYKDDNTEFRILKGSTQEFPDLTPTKCHQHCYKQGFRYFGLTYM